MTYSEYPKSVIIAARRDGNTVALSLGKFLEPGDTVDIIRQNEDEISLKVTRK
ncbi:MAG: hypothetical protein PHW62_00550 [Candidatus Ratteibacteria bacterium]|nr:hypothetical protein [Candidatus Ratteibacteria bacterium]